MIDTYIRTRFLKCALVEHLLFGMPLYMLFIIIRGSGLVKTDAYETETYAGDYEHFFLRVVNSWNSFPREMKSLSTVHSVIIFRKKNRTLHSNSIYFILNI